MSSDVIELPYLFAGNQAICWPFPHGVHTDGGDAQHRRDGHYHHLKAQFKQALVSRHNNTKLITDKTEESGGAGAENVDPFLQHHEILRSECPTMLLSHW